MDILYITHVLHQWDWEEEMKCLVQLVRLSSGCGSTVVGFQVGGVEGRKILASDLAKSDTYRHKPESFAQMWKQVGQQTGTRWESNAWLLTWEDVGWDPKIRSTWPVMQESFNLSSIGWSDICAFANVKAPRSPFTPRIDIFESKTIWQK